MSNNQSEITWDGKGFPPPGAHVEISIYSIGGKGIFDDCKIIYADENEVKVSYGQRSYDGPEVIKEYKASLVTLRPIKSGEEIRLESMVFACRHLGHSSEIIESICTTLHEKGYL